MNKPIVINLFGGSGCGKSTGAAYIFSQLKMRGVNCELVTEFAKDKTWEKSTKVFENQAYIFGKQYFKITKLHGEVDVVITDAPLLLSVVYNNSDILKESFDNCVVEVFNSYTNFNYVLNRVKPYNPKGRWQTKEEAKQIDNKVIDTLNKYNVNFKTFNGYEDGYTNIVSDVLIELSRKDKL